jgi:hypothetical protein
MIEKTATSFFFEKGEIFNDNLSSRRLHDSSGIYLIVKILRPEIEQKKLSGKIELTILSNQARIVYVNVKPYEAVPALMELIRAAD